MELVEEEKTDLKGGEYWIYIHQMASNMTPNEWYCFSVTAVNRFTYQLQGDGMLLAIKISYSKTVLTSRPSLKSG